jgi:hypothetical protein
MREHSIGRLRLAGESESIGPLCRDPQVGVPELGLDDDDRYAFRDISTALGVAKLVRSDQPMHTGGHGSGV